uniref:Dehydrogenase/reductase SDR family member 4 n=1 Tax=Dunaliella tertiolecta TaxID=3047 RepID=A0A7S3QMG2_DUNTE|eukprot:CAMPEP_0202371244 /NCGR_PEP_ID=MMETSP1127-20130417/2683_1 /ASSEMBLY_ACC=CAM_ASM_000462 /TAXON_ID=3047 /ORGANISM="Dunaliella tertiolecta, Strain CCMP1320" /LENGTH=256 /DNA_ID=CAMNT_0048967423 /DNA_START=28 /DNA_END=798 /DNA_ORIENTATION=-
MGTQPRRFEGKVALVTAATAGIGKAIAERIAREGASVYICSRKQSSVEDTLAEFKSKGLQSVAGCACHVGSAEDRARLIRNAVQTFGKIDCLVSNAAVSPAAAPILETPGHAIDKILDINVKSAVLLVNEAIPHMARGGSITMISSVTAYNPPLPIGMYAVSKTALLGLVKGLAAELGPSHGIRVNGVAPGIVPTKLSAYLTQSPELAKEQANATYLKRLGTPEDMAAAVAFLASPDASYITGETLVVAGGMPSKL